MLKCREIHRLGDDYVDGTLPWRVRLSVQLHTLLCVHCRRYLRQLAALLKAFPHVHAPASDKEVEVVMSRLRDERENPEGKNL